MTTRGWGTGNRGWGPAALAFAIALPLAAQPQQPHAGYVYPAGGQRGTTIDVRVGGQFLPTVSKAYVSGSGVDATVLNYERPPTGAEAQKMRDEMRALNQKRAGSPAALTEADRKRAEEIRNKLEQLQRRQSIPALAEDVNLRITIAHDAATGPRRLRLETNGGLTNPLVFVVGELPEVSRKPARVAPAYNVFNGSTPATRQAARQPEPPTEVTPPVVVNGQMMPGATDRYRFQAHTGQRIVIAAEARELMPYVSDAVPGWFQTAVSLRDSQGREVAAADHYLFHPDPLLSYEIPADGEYIAEVHDAIFRGREDFVYRVSIGELPVITSIFPMGCKAGARTAIEMLGWNLAGAKLMRSFNCKSPGVVPAETSGGAARSNTVLFTVDSLPETMAKPGSGRHERAQKLKLPVIVNGRIANAGDTPFFRIDGRAGEEIVAEVTARRLGSPVDSVLRMTDSNGKEIAFNDDFEDKGAGLLTHQADSYISLKLPAKGTYYLQIADAQHKGGPEYGYRLRISHPRPDFELLVAPASVSVRAGLAVPLTVHTVRKDGFDGEITLKLKDAPASFTLGGAAIPRGQDRVRITLSVQNTPAGPPTALQLTGHATIAGREVSHTAVPAQDMEQAFAYHHLVAEDACMVRVIGAGASGLAWRALDKPVKLPAGGTAALEVFMPPRLRGSVRLALDDPPEGISIQSVSQQPNGVALLLKTQGEKLKPGSKGNLIVDAFRDTPANGKNAQQTRQPLGTLPAIPFEVVAAQ